MEVGLELLLELRVGALEELNLLRMLLLLQRPPLALTLLDGLGLGLELLHLALQVLLLRLELLDACLHVCLALLRLQRLAHAEGDRRLVERLVGRDGHPDLIAHQQQPPLSAVDRHLPDQLVEALGIELLAHGADARLARLALQQTLVELLLQVDHVQASGWRARHVLHPELSVLGPLPWREDGVEDVLCLRDLRLSLHWRQLLLATLGTWRATLLGPSALRGEQTRRVVLHQRVQRRPWHGAPGTI